MFEEKNEAADEALQQPDAQIRKFTRIDFFVGSKMLEIWGRWQWVINAEQLLCSDVMFYPNDGTFFSVTKVLIHPDDVHLIHKLIERCKVKKSFDFSFRIITTYGEVTTVQGMGVFECQEMEGFFDNLVRLPAEQYAERKLFNDLCEHDRLQLKAYQFAESIEASGIWFINSVTHESFYSNETFRIHGLLAQSLNSHLHTFSPFIHPDDRESVIAAIDNAYRQQIPLSLEYRLLLNRTETKYISNTTRWFYNEKGEHIVAGVMKDITNRLIEETENKEVVNELNVKVQQLKNAEGMMSLANWSMHVLTRKIVYSDQIYRIYGIRPGTGALGTNALMRFVHPQDLEKVTEMNRQLLYEHVCPDIEYRIIRPDGKMKYLRQKGKLIIDANDEMVIIGTIADITAYKATDNSISKVKSEVEILRSTLDQSQEMSAVCSWAWDVDTGEISFSKNFFEFLGYRTNANQLTQRIFLSAIYPEDKKLVTSNIERMLSGELSSDFSFRINRRSEVRHVAAVFRLFIGDDNKTFIATFHDITAEKVLQENLVEQQNMTELLSDASVDRVFVTDINNYVIRWNLKAEEDFRIRREEAIDRNIFDLFPTLKESNWHVCFQKALAGQRIYLKGQKSFAGAGYCDLAMLPLIDEQENVKAILTIVHDITQEYELRQQLTDRLGFIEKLMEATVDRIVALDKNMNYIYWNKKAEHYYGYYKEEVIGRNILEMFPGFIDDPTYAQFRKSLKGETVYIPARKNLEDRKGYFETYLIPITDEHDDVSGVLWIVHDLIGEYHLANQQRKAGHILESINEAYIEVDFSGKLLFINPRAEKFWNRTKDDLLEKNVIDIFSELQNPSATSALLKVLNDKKDVHGEFYSETTRRWLYLSCTVTNDGAIILFYDISDLKTSEDQLLQSKQFISDITNASPDFIIIIDIASDKIIYRNDSMIKFHTGNKISVDDTIADLTLSWIHPDDRENVIRYSEKRTRLTSDEIISTDFRAKNENEWQWFCIRSKVFKKDESGRPLQTISFIQNINEQKTASDKIEETTKYADTIIDASINRIAVYGLDLKILAWNKRSEIATGLKKEQVLGKYLYDVFPKVGEDETLHAAMDKALAGEYVYLSPKKAIYSEAIYERFYIPLQDSNGHTYAVLNIIHDVSEMARKEKELKELNVTLESKNKELEQKQEEIGRFSFVAGHDLREPLRKIRTFATWLIQKEGTRLSDRGKEYLDKINNSSARMDTLLEDLMVLIKAHISPETQEDVDLNSILKEATNDLAEMISESGAQIDCETLPVIRGNASQLKTLFKNLLSNALKFQVPGNKPVVKITTQTKDQQVKISFDDNGLGFEDKFSKQIFQAFQRLHHKEDFEGTGVGLAICKKIMENHGGYIVAESHQGKGSKFTCIFNRGTLGG